LPLCHLQCHNDIVGKSKNQRTVASTRVFKNGQFFYLLNDTFRIKYKDKWFYGALTAKVLYRQNDVNLIIFTDA